MRIILVIGLTFLSVTAFADSVSDRCRAERDEDLKLYASDLSWNQPYSKMMSLFESIYASGKRLPKRAYRDSSRGSYVMPFHHGKSGLVEISTDFIAAIRTHVEKALVRKYADAVFFSDLGHSHMLIPSEKYNREYRPIPVERQDELYNKAFADSEVRFLYHTAEQLDSTGSDPHMVWRRNTRNLVGENRPGGEVHVLPAYDDPAHTLRDVEGYYWFSAGFNISASAQGCFPFQTPEGRVLYFDLSLYDLESRDLQSRLVTR